MVTDNGTHDVHDNALERIRCGVCHSGANLGSTSPVEMTDTSVKVTFPRDEAPQLPLGEEVELSFTIDGREPLARPGRVQSRVDSDSDRTYVFALLQTERAREEIWRVFRSAFNMRDAFRVRPGSTSPIEVTIRIATERSFSQPLVVEDISATGLAGRASMDAEEVLSRFDQARLHMTLEEGGRPIQLDAHIVGRDLMSPSVNYRFAFVRETGRQELELDEVMQYIMEYQRRLAATSVH